jgi:hypothetical protein
MFIDKLGAVVDFVVHNHVDIVLGGMLGDIGKRELLCGHVAYRKGRGIEMCRMK